MTSQQCTHSWSTFLRFIVPATDSRNLDEEMIAYFSNGSGEQLWQTAIPLLFRLVLAFTPKYLNSSSTNLQRILTRQQKRKMMVAFNRKRQSWHWRRAKIMFQSCSMLLLLSWNGQLVSASDVHSSFPREIVTTNGLLNHFSKIIQVPIPFASSNDEDSCKVWMHEKMTKKLFVVAGNLQN